MILKEEMMIKPKEIYLDKMENEKKVIPSFVCRDCKLRLPTYCFKKKDGIILQVCDTCNNKG